MRNLLFALMITVAVPAHAAYSTTTQGEFSRGCNAPGAQLEPLQRGNLKKLCACGLAKLEATVPEDQFVKFGTLPDKGQSQLQPILLGCMNK